MRHLLYSMSQTAWSVRSKGTREALPPPRLRMDRLHRRLYRRVHSRTAYNSVSAAGNVSVRQIVTALPCVDTIHRRIQEIRYPLQRRWRHTRLSQSANPCGFVSSHGPERVFRAALVRLARARASRPVAPLPHVLQDPHSFPSKNGAFRARRYRVGAVRRLAGWFAHMRVDVRVARASRRARANLRVASGELADRRARAGARKRADTGIRKHARAVAHPICDAPSLPAGSAEKSGSGYRFFRFGT